MDDSGHARIADFGLATVTQNLDSRRSVSYQRGHTVRWTAPEVLNEGTYSTEADIFSFAMVMIEVCRRSSPLWSLGLLSFNLNTGVHRCSSLQRCYVCHGYVGHNTRQAPTTTDASKLHGGSVGINGALLGSGPSLAPRGFCSLANSSHPVSPSFISTTIR